MPVAYEDPRRHRAAIGAVLDAGFTHIVLSLRAPHPDSVARWIATEIIAPSRR